MDVDIVFAGGEPSQYLSLLRRVRAERPELPFVVVTRIPETTEWLDALEAGATDYCSSPFEARQIHWLMEAALPRQRSIAAA
jgi:DNA-binding response OmpR family regulator